MNSQSQTWGWLATGVLAFAMNSLYHNAGAEMVHRIMGRATTRAEAVLDLVSAQSDRMMEGAESLAAKVEVASCRLKSAVATLKGTLTEQQRQPESLAMLAMPLNGQVLEMQVDRTQLEAKLAKLETTKLKLAKIDLNRLQSLRVRNAARVHGICPGLLLPTEHVRVVRAPIMRIPAPIVHVNIGPGPV